MHAVRLRQLPIGTILPPRPARSFTPTQEAPVTIRDLSVTQRCAWLDELISVCLPGGAVSKKCPALAADLTRKANAMKGVLLRLSQSLSEAGPPPAIDDRPPLYLRQTDPVIQQIAKCLGHQGALEDTLFLLTKDLAGRYGNERVSDAVTELVWIDRETRWAKLRPETVRALRPFIGPAPDDAECERWWRGQGMEPPEPRSPRRTEPVGNGKAEPAKKRTGKKRG
jgi:hypothetical protein